MSGMFGGKSAENIESQLDGCDGCVTSPGLTRCPLTADSGEQEKETSVPHCTSACHPVSLGPTGRPEGWPCERACHRTATS